MSALVKKLDEWLNETEARLSSSSGDVGELVSMKNEILAVKYFLQVSSRSAFSSKSKIFILPAQLNKSASSEYRIIEDMETDDQTKWQEVLVSGEFLRLNEGDIVISN